MYKKEGEFSPSFFATYTSLKNQEVNCVNSLY